MADVAQKVNDVIVVNVSSTKKVNLTTVSYQAEWTGLVCWSGLDSLDWTGLDLDSSDRIQ